MFRGDVSQGGSTTTDTFSNGRKTNERSLRREDTKERVVRVYSSSALRDAFTAGSSKAQAESFFNVLLERASVRFLHWAPAGGITAATVIFLSLYYMVMNGRGMIEMASHARRADGRCYDMDG